MHGTHGTPSRRDAYVRGWCGPPTPTLDLLLNDLSGYAGDSQELCSTIFHHVIACGALAHNLTHQDACICSSPCFFLEYEFAHLVFAAKRK